MKYNVVFDNLDDALPPLLRDLLQGAPEHDSRAGLTKELRFVGITLLSPLEREITLKQRRANVSAQIVESMWVLSGRNDIAGLLPYLPRAADFSDNGRTWRAGYGPRLRNFNGVDQLAYIVDTLRRDPATRQAVATIWDPKDDTTPGKDIACNNWLSFSAREGTLDLMVGLRSNDAMWGWSGINAFEWSVLLEVVASLTGLRVGALHFATASFHLYETHWAKAARIADESSCWVGEPGPYFDGSMTSGVEDLDDLLSKWFAIEELIRTGRHEPLQVEMFPEPMLRSWLRVLQWYWSGNVDYLEAIKDTRLAEACRVGMRPAGVPQAPRAEESVPLRHSRFLNEVNALHAEKHAAYGDSWKRRGEPGILGNIARKVDRIGSGKDTSDETQADTAMDLMVYLAKYRCWLNDPRSGGPADVDRVLYRVRGHIGPVHYLTEDFDLLQEAVRDNYDQVIPIVDRMLEQSMSLAKQLWKG